MNEFHNYENVALTESTVRNIRGAASSNMILSTVMIVITYLGLFPFREWYPPHKQPQSPTTYSMIYLTFCLCVSGAFIYWGYYQYILMYDLMDAFLPHIYLSGACMLLHIVNVVNCHYELRNRL